MSSIESSKHRRSGETTREKRARRWPRIALALVFGFVVAAGFNVYSAMSGFRTQLGTFAAGVQTRSPPLRGAIADRLDEEETARQPLAVEPLIEPELGAAVRAEERPRWQSPPLLQELDAEHWPAEPAVQQFIADPAAFRLKIETLLASDPDTLEEVRALLDERDPLLLAENVRLLQETFAVE